MIVFDLECRGSGHRFEGWFASSDDFAKQQQRGLVTCPQCGAGDVIKALMAPHVGRKSNQRSSSRPLPLTSASPAGGQLPQQALAMLKAMAAMQAEVLKDSRWVGKDFAEVSRDIHYGEREAETIHGQATAKEALELIEEGIEIMPLPLPVAPPGETN